MRHTVNLDQMLESMEEQRITLAADSTKGHRKELIWLPANQSYAVTENDNVVAQLASLNKAVEAYNDLP